MWKTVKLGDICTLRNGRAYKKPELLNGGKYPVLRVGNFFTSNNWYYSDLELDETKYCDNGDLLYAWSASFGARIWEGEKSIYHYHIWRVDVDETQINKMFLFYWLDYDKELIKAAHGTGATMMHVSKGSMEKRELSLPPLAEQQRIVAKLDAAFAEIYRASTVVRQQLLEAESLYANILMRCFDDSSVARKPLSELCRITSSKRIMVKDYVEVGIPFYRTKEVKQLANNLPVSTELFIAKEQFDSLREKFGAPTEGDILITAIGTIGEVYIVKDGDEFYFKDGNVLWLKEIKDVNQEYLRYGLLSFVENLNSLAHGAAYSALPIQRLKAFALPVPQIESQIAIVRRLEQSYTIVAMLKKTLQSKLSAMHRLKSAILAQELQPTESEAA